MKKIAFSILILLFIYSNFSFPQGTAGENYLYETKYLVEMPTAGILPKNSYSFYNLFYPNGVILSLFEISFLENFSLGISYSGNNIIGTGNISFQGLPGFHLKIRIINEQQSFPALAIGINTQGRGIYDKNKKRFQTYSPGVYLAISRNYRWLLGLCAFHLGLGYSLEPSPNERTLNYWCGVEQTLFKFTSIFIEYNATAEEKSREFINKNGLLNAGLKFSIANGITFELFAKDLLNHLTNAKGHSRVIAIDVIKKF